MILHQKYFLCGLVVAGGLVTSSLAFSQSTPASGASVASQSVNLRGVYQAMPAGDHFVAPSATELKALETPRPLPMGDAAFISNVAKAAAQAEPTGAPGDLVKPGSRSANGPSPQGVSGPSCLTNVATGFAPSDIHGAASSTVQVVVTNVDIGVYNRANCALISRVSLKTFFNRVSATETLFDPRVIYDRRTGRFLVSAESQNSVNTDQFQFFAVSTSSNASAFFKYTLGLSVGAGRFCKRAVNSFWDYPSVGVNAYRWYVTANDFPVVGAATGATLVINKSPTLTGGTTTVSCFALLASNIAPPIVLDTSTTATLLSPGSGGGNAIMRRDFLVNTAGAGNTDTLAVRPSYPIPAWISSAGGVQPNGQRLDALDGRFQSASIQSRGLLWNVHAINQGGFARSRLYRLTNLSTTASPAPSLIFTPITTVNDDIFNPSVATGSGAVNAPIFMTVTRTIRTIPGPTGNALILMLAGLNASSVSSDWAAYGIRASSVAIATTNGSTSCNTSSRLVCRWGDYSATQVDPLSSGRGLGWNQFNPGPGTTQFNWATASGQVDLSLPFGPTAAAQ